MPIYKNTASQKLAVVAWDKVAGAPKTGDAANITAEISLDGAASTATNDANPSELDATDHPGVYIFDLTQAETNANMIIVTPVSATENIVFTQRSIIEYTVAGGGDASGANQTTIINHLTDIKGGGWSDETLVALKAETALIVADTNELQTDDTPGALSAIDAKIDTIDGIVDNILTDTGTTLDTIVDSILEDTGTTIPGLIAALNNISTAEVNAEVVDALGTDTLAELSAGQPTATPTIKQAIMLLYMACRNKEEQTATEYRIHNNAGAVICEADLTDDGSTAAKSQLRASD